MHIIPDPASESSDLSSLQIEDFWDRHGKTVIIAAVVVVIAAIITVIVFINQHNRQIEAEAAFADAKSEAELHAVIGKYPGSAPAADAALLLAGLQRKAGRYDEALVTLETFLKVSPDNSLAGLASLGIATNQEAMGKFDESRATLRQTASRFSNSFVAPYALWSEAEAFIVQGKNEEAASILRNLAAQYPDSISSRVGAQNLERLESVADTNPKN